MLVLFPTGATGGCRMAPAHLTPAPGAAQLGPPARLSSSPSGGVTNRRKGQYRAGERPVSACAAQLLRLFFYLFHKLQEITTCNVSQTLQGARALCLSGAEGLLPRCRAHGCPLSASAPVLCQHSAGRAAAPPAGPGPGARTKQARKGDKSRALDTHRSTANTPKSHDKVEEELLHNKFLSSSLGKIKTDSFGFNRCCWKMSYLLILLGRKRMIKTIM